MTHGRGKKGGRGAGLRGGRGNAGLRKHRIMYMLKNMPNHFGRHGFKRPQSIIRRDKTINVGQLEEKFPDKKNIDLAKEGFDKLLGGGKVNNPVNIACDTPAAMNNDIPEPIPHFEISSSMKNTSNAPIIS